MGRGAAVPLPRPRRRPRPPRRHPGPGRPHGGRVRRATSRRGLPDAAPAFAAATELFEAVWYGGATTGPAEARALPRARRPGAGGARLMAAPVPRHGRRRRRRARAGRHPPAPGLTRRRAAARPAVRRARRHQRPGRRCSTGSAPTSSCRWGCPTPDDDVALVLVGPPRRGADRAGARLDACGRHPRGHRPGVVAHARGTGLPDRHRRAARPGVLHDRRARRRGRGRRRPGPALRHGRWRLVLPRQPRLRVRGGARRG